jgi:antitoxin VapB
MTLQFDDPRIETLAHELADRTGKNIEAAVVMALEDRLRHTTPRKQAEEMMHKLEAIRLRLAARPILDTRTDDEILGYNELGLPG